jgi:hypothetical protein
VLHPPVLLFSSTFIAQGHLVAEYGGYEVTPGDKNTKGLLNRLQTLKPSWLHEWKKHVRLFSERASSPGLVGKQSRPQFKKPGSKESVLYSLQTLFKTAKLGGFINSSKCSRTSCDPNVEAILFEGRQFYVATRDIMPGEQILHDYPALEHHEDTDSGISWFVKGGLSHSLAVLVNDAEEECARETGGE